jgi:hypothetical protein
MVVGDDAEDRDDRRDAEHVPPNGDVVDQRDEV